MSLRIQTDRGIPTHSVETYYLNQIVIGVKLALNNLPMEKLSRPITAVFLAEWPLKHRTHFSGCSAFDRQGYLPPVNSPRDVNRLFDIHREDIERIDVFIKALQQGLEEAALTKYVTDADVHAIELTIGRLEACTEKTRWD